MLGLSNDLTDRPQLLCQIATPVNEKAVVLLVKIGKVDCLQ